MWTTSRETGSGPLVFVRACVFDDNDDDDNGRYHSRSDIAETTDRRGGLLDRGRKKCVLVYIKREKCNAATKRGTNNSFNPSGIFKTNNVSGKKKIRFCQRFGLICIFFIPVFFFSS